MHRILIPLQRWAEPFSLSLLAGFDANNRRIYEVDGVERQPASFAEGDAIQGSVFHVPTELITVHGIILFDATGPVAIRTFDVINVVPGSSIHVHYRLDGVMGESPGPWHLVSGPPPTPAITLPPEPTTPTAFEILRAGDLLL